jgi:hypothetical protein
VEAFAAALEGLALAEWLRYSRWGYAAVSAAHVLGIALLLGAVVTLDLRLLGLWRSLELVPLYRVLSSVAATGLLVAVSSGLLLFSVRASEYAAIELFFVKLALIAAGAGLAAVMHFGLGVERSTRGRQRLFGALSLLIWPAVLVCGRLLAFV